MAWKGEMNDGTGGGSQLRICKRTEATRKKVIQIWVKDLGKNSKIRW